MDDPDRYAGLAEPLGAAFAPMQPADVLPQRGHQVPGDVLAEILAQLLLAFGGHRYPLDHHGRALGQDGGGQAAEHAAEAYEPAKESGLVLGRETDAEQDGRPSEGARDDHLDGDVSAIAESDDNIRANLAGKLGREPRIV